MRHRTEAHAHADGLAFADAQELIARHVRALGNELVPAAAAVGRVLAEDVRSRVDVPPFARSAVDGFAVASDAIGPVFAVVADLYPGELPTVKLGPGEAARIRTGAPLPDGADAVVRLEDVEDRGASVRISRGIERGKRDVSPRGEDVAAGASVLRAGRVVRPQDVGVASAVGEYALSVRRRPRIVVVSTGDELVAAGDRLRDGAIFDANGPMLEALARAEGALVERAGIVRDEAGLLRAALAGAEGDVSISSGAASVGSEDVLPALLSELGVLFVHGVAMRPGHPVAFGRIGERLHFVLPGNPVAAWAGFRFFVRPALRLLAGHSRERAFAPDRTIRAHLARPVTSARGRTDVVRVRFDRDGTVDPVGAGGASRVTTLTSADGFFVIPPQVDALSAGDAVEVELL